MTPFRWTETGTPQRDAEADDAGWRARELPLDDGRVLVLDGDPPEPDELVIEPWLDLSACDAQAGAPFPDYDHVKEGVKRRI